MEYYVYCSWCGTEYYKVATTDAERAQVPGLIGTRYDWCRKCVIPASPEPYYDE